MNYCLWYLCGSLEDSDHY